MENLNAEQVKKALECYSEKKLISECEKGCAFYEIYRGFSTCCLPVEENIMKYALALINSQEQRIKELTEENERLRLKDAENAVSAFRDAATILDLQQRLKHTTEVVEYVMGLIEKEMIENKEAKGYGE